MVVHSTWSNMKYKRQRKNSSSSDDDEPLASTLAPKRYKKIYRCDFCDLSIENELKLLIHTVDHLIIPLINLKIHQCSECLFCFTSQNSLQEHITSKHPVTIDSDVLQKSSHDKEKPVLQLVEIKTEPESAPVKIENDGLKLKNRIVFEDDPDDEENEIFSDELLNDLTTDCKVKLEIFDAPFLTQISENAYSNDDYENVFIDNGNRDRNVKDFVETDANLSEKTIQRNNIGSKQHVNIEYEKKEGTEAVKYSPSIHYSELIKPGIFRCKKCQKMFATRFEMIQHEATHMRYKKPRHIVCNACDRYIAGSGITLHRHFITSHPNRVYRKQTLTKCNKCGLKYANYDRHSVNYHKWFPCSVCGTNVESFSIVQHMKEHIDIDNTSQHIGENSAIHHQNGVNSAIHHQNGVNSAIHHQNGVNSAILHQNGGNSALQNSVRSAFSHEIVEIEFKFCDVCLMFIHSHRGYVYTVLGNIKSVNSEKLKCDDCKKMCDNLKLVKRRKRYGPAVERMNTNRKPKKPLSNEVRLRNIQNRLKLFKNNNKGK